MMQKRITADYRVRIIATRLGNDDRHEESFDTVHDVSVQSFGDALVVVALRAVMVGDAMERPGSVFIDGRVRRFIDRIQNIIRDEPDDQVVP